MKKYALLISIFVLICSFGITKNVFAYSQINFDGTNVPTVSHGDCLILWENLNFPPQPAVSGKNFPFSGTGYRNNTGGGVCNLSNSQFVTVLNDVCAIETSGNFAWEWGENSLFPFTADYWGNFTCSSGSWVPPTPPNYNTRIDTFTYSTSTQTANITGYINSTSSKEYDELTFWQSSNLVGQEAYQFLKAESSGAFNVTYPINIYSSTSTGTTTQPLGVNYTLNAVISAVNENLYTSDVVASSSIDIVASSTILTLQDILNYPEYECGITSLTGCIKNAFVWAFYPAPATVEGWQTFQQLLNTKAPTGYFNVVKDGLNGLNASSTPGLSVVIPGHIKDIFFSPFDIAISSILWFSYLIFMYKRIKNIDL